MYSTAQKYRKLTRDADHVAHYAILIACYTIPVLQDTILVACDGLKL